MTPKYYTAVYMVSDEDKEKALVERLKDDFNKGRVTAVALGDDISKLDKIRELANAGQLDMIKGVLNQ